MQGVDDMKLVVGLLGAACFFAGAGSALADVPCQKCTQEMQTQYRKCLRSGKDETICAKEEQEAAQLCVAICNPK